jgi:hypothetical protein
VSAVPLVAMSRAEASLERGRLHDHLAAIRIPPRSAALLREAGYGLQATGHGNDATTAAAEVAVGAGLARLAELLVAGATDAASWKRAVARLVGLGPGLTPSGDDVLVALVATSRRLAAGGLLSATAVTQLVAAVAKLPQAATTEPAHRLLVASAAGECPPPLADLVGALGDPAVSRDEIALGAERLAAVGAHTGADWLAGVVALCRAAGNRGGAA